MPTPPRGTWDCHAHIFADPTLFPLAAGADYRPSQATASDYRRQLEQIGVERCVLVQPSVYGTDNSCLVDALGQLGTHARGIAVISSDTPLPVLQALHSAGVRGVRLNTLAANGPALSQLPQFERCISPLPWHLQILLRPDAIAEAITHLEAIACPVVLDHFASCTPETPAEQLDALFALAARKSNLWIKLSAPYLFSDCSTAALGHYQRFVQRALNVMPERLLWATDWPHTARHDVDIASEQLFPLLASWVDDPEQLQQIAVGNPSRLYGP